MNVNILLSKLSLYKEIDNDKLHVLAFGVYKNTLRIYVKESPKDDLRNNQLVFNMGVVTMNARLIANALETLNDQKEGYNLSFPMYGKKFVNNQPVDGERELTGTIGVARAKNKSEDIVNLIYVTTPIGTKYIFPLTPTPYIDIVINGETVKDNKKLSEIWTKAFSDTFTAVLNNIPEAHAKDPKQASNNSMYQSKPGAKPTIVSNDDLLKDL